MVLFYRNHPQANACAYNVTCDDACIESETRFKRNIAMTSFKHCMMVCAWLNGSMYCCELCCHFCFEPMQEIMVFRS